MVTETLLGGPVGYMGMVTRIPPLTETDRRTVPLGHTDTHLSQTDEPSGFILTDTDLHWIRKFSQTC